MTIHTLTRDEFEDWLLVGDKKHPRTARMVDRAKKFIGGMGDRSRTVFLEAAMDFAWDNRYGFNPQYESPDMYWSRCLRAAALTRDKWLVDVATLPGVYEKRWVLGRMLGE